ncbi:MAG: hypothetical protein ABI254_03735, partial [Chthoniobacterales bacterium]
MKKYPTLLFAACLAFGSLNSMQAEPFLPISIQPFIPKAETGKEVAETLTKDGIPFSVIDGGKVTLSLDKAGWPEGKLDPQDYYENYDDATKNVASANLPLLSIPREDYIAAYVLCRADADPATSNVLTLRAGPRVGGAGLNSETWMKDFTGVVPRSSAGKAGEAPLVVVRIPFTEAFSQ